jgi:hypothetical protein
VVQAIQAAEAQEALEDESLEATQQEVQQELAESLSGSEVCLLV